MGSFSIPRAGFKNAMQIPNGINSLGVGMHRNRCFHCSTQLRVIIDIETPLMAIATTIHLPQAEIAEICRRHQVSELSLFGSASRGELRPDSDIDFLVDFLPGARPGLLGVSAMTRELTTLLGRQVDLVVKPALKPLVRAGVLADAQLLYAA